MGVAPVVRDGRADSMPIALGPREPIVVVDERAMEPAAASHPDDGRGLQVEKFGDLPRKCFLGSASGIIMCVNRRDRIPY